MTFEELGPGDCRFPVAERDAPNEWSTILFCGEPVSPSQLCPSYCAEHRAIAYPHPRAKRPRRIAKWEWQHHKLATA
jgi:hypothetical protein